MVTRRISFDNGTPGLKLFDTDPTRVCFAIHVPITEDSVAILDDPFTPGGAATINLDPGDTLFMSALEGHNVTKPWYIISNTILSNDAYLYEEFIDPGLMEILKTKGIINTQGLPFLMLALLAGSQ